MKKFFKRVGIVALVLLFLGGIYLFSVKDKITLTINIFKKYSEFIDENNISKENITSIDLESDKDYKEVEYKNTNGVPLTLDIFEAKKTLKKGSPVIVYVHGGSWVYGDKEIPNVMSPLLDAFREEGFTIISTSYELMREKENFNKQIADIKDTIRWIYKNKEEYNFNTDKIGVIGASSGAQLSLIATYSSEEEFIDSEELKNYPSDIKFLIDFFGPTDLNTLDMSNVTWDLQQVIDSLGEDKAEVFNKYSPINYVDSNETNTLIIHSKKDALVPYINAELLYNKLKDNKNKVTMITLEGASHDFSEFDVNEIVDVGTKMLKFILQNI